MSQRASGANSKYTRRRILHAIGITSTLSLAGCTEGTDDEDGGALTLEEFLSEHSEADARAGENFIQAYSTVMETPANQLTAQDFEQARDMFNQSREDYDQLEDEAEAQYDVHDEGAELAEIFDTLSTYYGLMVEASSYGFQGLDALLEEENVVQAFSRSAAAFEMMEDTYADAQDLRKEIILYRDTRGTSAAEIVGDWITDHESEIQTANSLFDEGTTAFNEREYTAAQDSFVNAGEKYGELLNAINSEFATTYPQESDLYQFFGGVSYYFDRMRTASEAAANSARLRSEGDYQSAVEYEATAEEAYPEAIDAWTSAQENITTLDGQFDPPELPQFEAETDPVESREEAETIVREWLEENENSINAQFNYMGVAEDEYAAERYEDASEWYHTVAEDWGELEQNAAEQADEYQNEFLVETFTLLRDYFAALRNVAETMQRAASAREAGLEGEAEALEEEADEYRDESEDIRGEINRRVSNE